MPAQKTLLIILDGFGIAPHAPHNAITTAKMPFYNGLLKDCPHGQLMTHGEVVGLPEGTMGNSEVGHMTIGSGQVIYQDLVRINKSIHDQSFFKNPQIFQAITDAAKNKRRVHLLGMISDAGVHSHIDHLYALLKLCEQTKVSSLSVHAILDGRDTPPSSGKDYLNSLVTSDVFRSSGATLASLSGRYFAMDRDKRWERTQKAVDAISGQIEPVSISPQEALEASYKNETTDEFFEPQCFDKEATVSEGDVVIFFNYRADRARQITRALSHQLSEGVKVKSPKAGAFVCMTQYDAEIQLPIAFEPKTLDCLFGQHLEDHGLSQFRIAETEKYGHVTFFFNGGREKPFNKEERELISSPKDCATYDEKPEMSAPQVASELAKRIKSKKYDFILANFANADMVGHTGNIQACIQAMEVLDQCLKDVITEAQKAGYTTILTADHGNAEELIDSKGRSHTQHTLNPVPALLISPGDQQGSVASGSLADIMPTLCQLMELPVPDAVTGESLLKGKDT